MNKKDVFNVGEDKTYSNMSNRGENVLLTGNCTTESIWVTSNESSL